MRKEIEDFKNSFISCIDGLEVYNTSSMKHDAFRVIRGLSDILDYLEKTKRVNIELFNKYRELANDLFACIVLDLEDSKEKLDSQIFSIAEWNSASEERKLSIISFILATGKSSQVKADEYESIFNQFDKETLEWLKDNSPYEEVRESLAYHYCKDDKDE